MEFACPYEKYDWSFLNNKANKVLLNILEDWENLLGETRTEESYHRFIAEHAGFFLCDHETRFVAISKLRLGADHLIDFAVAEERRSKGLYWELIEIENPHTPPFIRRGVPSAKLTNAIQQVLDWKRWLIENRREAERLFPADGVRTQKNPNFGYTIIIGTRMNTEKWVHKRNQLSEELGIEIRSFDYLADAFRTHNFFDRAILASAEAKILTDWQLNYLANPFSMAYNDSIWREILKEIKPNGRHFVSLSAESLLLHQQYNKSRFSQFQHLVKSG